MRLAAAPDAPTQTVSELRKGTWRTGRRWKGEGVKGKGREEGSGREVRWDFEPLLRHRAYNCGCASLISNTRWLELDASVVLSMPPPDDLDLLTPKRNQLIFVPRRTGDKV